MEYKCYKKNDHNESQLKSGFQYIYLAVLSFFLLKKYIVNENYMG